MLLEPGFFSRPEVDSDGSIFGEGLAKRVIVSLLDWIAYFPTCHMRAVEFVRFYDFIRGVSSSSFSFCSSSSSILAQWALPDLNCQLTVSVSTAGPQPPERMPTYMPDRMPEYMSDYMSDRNRKSDYR